MLTSTIEAQKQALITFISQLNDEQVITELSSVLIGNAATISDSDTELKAIIDERLSTIDKGESTWRTFEDSEKYFDSLVS